MAGPPILATRPDRLPSICQESARIVRHGGVIAVPTESFYALAADPLKAEAVARVAVIKGRPSDKPILVLLANAAQVGLFASAPSPLVRALMEAYWPGPLTLVVPARPGLPVELTAGTGTVGVRWSAHPILQAIVSETGPLTGTSANRSGAPPCTLAAEVVAACGDDLDLIVDDGATAGGPPSTVLALTGRPQLVRAGAISAASLRETLASFGETLA